MDYDKIKQAVELFLEGIGEDPSREGLQETPDRIAKMCRELFAGYEQDASVHLSRTFQADTSSMVVEKDITFYSVCEHHFLPFYGKVHIGYVPDGKVVGLSKLQPKGVMVYVEAEHMCMTMRGVKKPGSKTTTYVAKGVMEHDQSLQNMFMNMI